MYKVFSRPCGSKSATTLGKCKDMDAVKSLVEKQSGDPQSGDTIEMCGYYISGYGSSEYWYEEC